MSNNSKAWWSGVKGIGWTGITVGFAMMSEIYSCKMSGDIPGKENVYHFNAFYTSGNFLFIILAIAAGILLDFLIEYKEAANRARYGTWTPILIIGCSVGIFVASFLSTTTLQAGAGGLTPAGLSESTWTFWGSLLFATISKGFVFYANSKSS
jgi:hypothetical protein